MSLRTHLTALEASGLIRLAAIEPDIENLFRHALAQSLEAPCMIPDKQAPLSFRKGERL